jgi:hypothetical protein
VTPVQPTVIDLSHDWAYWTEADEVQLSAEQEMTDKELAEEWARRYPPR